MMSATRVLFAIGLAILSAASPAAAEPYVTARMMDIAALLAPPPVVGSAADIADLRAVLAAQAQASEARKDQALADSVETVFVMFTRVLGTNFVTASLPKATVLFARVSESEAATVDPAKPFFARLRPWMAHPEVQIFTRRSKRGSYPSGHSTQVTINAILLSAMVPERRQEIWARADDYTQSRIVGGMHYPTDVEAGRRAGTAMAAVMFQLPHFRADFDAVRSEIRTALSLPAPPAK